MSLTGLPTDSLACDLACRGYYQRRLRLPDLVVKTQGTYIFIPDDLWLLVADLGTAVFIHALDGC